MENIFGKDRVFTVPNLLSLLRLLMVPWIAVRYRSGDSLAAAALVVCSGLTDVADGLIARRWNQVTNLGKILDPVADKLTLGTMIFCLIPKYRSMILLLTLFLMRELVMAGLGLAMIHTREEVHSARWYGKAATALLYAAVFYLMLRPQAGGEGARVLIGGCAAVVALAWLGYLLRYRKLWNRLRREN